MLLLLLLVVCDAHFLALTPLSETMSSAHPPYHTMICEDVTECFYYSEFLRSKIPYVTYYLPYRAYMQNIGPYANYDVDDDCTDCAEIWCNISKNNWKSPYESYENKMVVFGLIKHGFIFKLQICKTFGHCLRIGSKMMSDHYGLIPTFGITGMGYYNKLLSSVESQKKYVGWYYYSEDEYNDIMQTIKHQEKMSIC